jgi:CMP-N-acetylneuraminic acid synthetase
MVMKKTICVPIKLNNERTPGKNIKSFDNGYPLAQYMLRTLDKCVEAHIIDEVFCFCSSEEIIDFFPKDSRVRFLRRDKALDSPAAITSDILKAFCDQVDSDIYVLAHVTCPFTSKETIKRAVDIVESGISDSAIACRKIQTFLFNEEKKPMNFDPLKMPRTQDLKALFEPTTGLWAFSKQLAKSGKIVGENPQLFEVAPIETVDIDYPEDFEFANIVWNGLKALRMGGGGGDICVISLSIPKSASVHGRRLLCA